MKYDSIMETKLAAKISKLGGRRCDTFLPLMTDRYKDANGEEYLAKPDFLIRRPSGFTFLETKGGKLNYHPTRADATAGLRKAYRECFDCSGDGMSHGQLSTALYAHSLRGQVLSRQHSFHHSLFKLAAVQAKHGYQRYLVVFDANPTGREAERYCKAGLVWCTIATLPDFLNSIELMEHGIYVPFLHTAKNYQFTVAPDMAGKGMHQADIEMIDRGRFLWSVASDKAEQEAKEEKRHADTEARLAAGFPF